MEVELLYDVPGPGSAKKGDTFSYAPVMDILVPSVSPVVQVAGPTISLTLSMGQHGKSTMAKSLQDQLLNAGLANKKQAVRAKKAKNNKEKLKRSGVDVVDEVALSAKEAAKNQVERDRELNRQRVATAEQKAIFAQIRQIVSLNRIIERGDVEFSFTDGGVIKTIHIAEEHRNGLVRGALVIVRMDDSYEILSRNASNKIAERDESIIVLCNEATASDGDDDEYADFKVPDDLMW